MERRQPKVLSAPPVAQSWWTFPITAHREASGVRIQVAWGRLGLHLLSLTIAAWLVMGCGTFLWVKYYRGFAEARIVDILLPNRWASYRTARGNFYIKQAMQELADQKPFKAIHHLRVGVAAAPSNLEGRITLAKFFSYHGRFELARRTLLDGIPHSQHDPEFVRALFAFLLRYQEDEQICRLAADLLPATPLVDNRNQLIALAAATAHFHRGNYDEAETLLRAYALADTKDGRLLAVRIEWDRGHHDLALLRLESYLRLFPAEEDFYNQLALFNRELGRFAAVEKYAILRQIANPRSTAARIDLLLAYKLNHDTAQYQREVDAFFRDFPGDPAVLEALANFGAGQGDTALVLRVRQHLLARNLPTAAVGLMIAEAHLVAGEHRAALDYLYELGRARPEWFQKSLGFINGLQAVACYGLDQREDADLYLQHFLAQPEIRAEQLAAIANHLVVAGAKRPARQVLAQAVAADPRNQNALTRLIALDLEGAPTPELTANLRRLLAMRRPAPAVLQLARTRLSSDRYLFVAGREELLAAIQAALARGPVLPVTAL